MVTAAFYCAANTYNQTAFAKSFNIGVINGWIIANQEKIAGSY